MGCEGSPTRLAVLPAHLHGTADLHWRGGGLSAGGGVIGGWLGSVSDAVLFTAGTGAGPGRVDVPLGMTAQVLPLQLGGAAAVFATSPRQSQIRKQTGKHVAVTATGAEQDGLFDHLP